MKMTVAELIAELQTLDPSKKVNIVVGGEERNIIDTADFELHATDDGVEYVEFFVHSSSVMPLVSECENSKFAKIKTVVTAHIEDLERVSKIFRKNDMVATADEVLVAISELKEALEA